MSAAITKRGLRSMQARWERDLGVLEASFPGLDISIHFTPEAETIRNLATAIAEMNAVLKSSKPLASRVPETDQ